MMSTCEKDKGKEAVLKDKTVYVVYGENDDTQLMICDIFANEDSMILDVQEYMASDMCMDLNEFTRMKDEAPEEFAEKFQSWDMTYAECMESREYWAEGGYNIRWGERKILQWS